MFKYKMLVLLLFTSLVNMLHAANSNDLPLSMIEKMKFADETQLELTALNQLALEKEDTYNAQRGQPYRFAINRYEKIEGEFSSKGRWFEKDNTSIWRLPVYAHEAVSLSFSFEEVFLPAGAKLFIYDDSGSQSFVYTDADNKPHKKLWTAMIEADTAFIEINVPTKLKQFLSFKLHSVNHGYRSTKVKNSAKSGSCNIDVVCPDGDDWRDEIRSVARYSYSTAGGVFFCTGQLVNNTSGDQTPYFLTANHCINTVDEAQSMVFYWNYETSVCNGVPNGTLAQSQSGASLVSTRGSGEFEFYDTTLVSLDATPEDAFNVHWAGWDVNNIAPSSSVAIHHPGGDEKRISFDDDPAAITNPFSSFSNSNGNYLRIGSWERGTTELGSSGSGLWNVDKRIVGVLSGGTASCTAPNDPDWYGRLAPAWEGGGTPETQLKGWLDPINTGILTLDGTDACTPPSVSISIDPNPAEVGQAISFNANVTGGSGAYTYAWNFDEDAAIDSTQASARFTYDQVYQGNVSLRVDDTGCSAGITEAIVVTNAGGSVSPPSSGGGGSLGVLFLIFLVRLNMRYKMEKE